jgi:hypothetical protein
MCIVNEKEPYPLLCIPLSVDEETNWSLLCWLVRKKKIYWRTSSPRNSDPRNSPAWVK